LTKFDDAQISRVVFKPETFKQLGIKPAALVRETGLSYSVVWRCMHGESTPVEIAARVQSYINERKSEVHT